MSPSLQAEEEIVIRTTVLFRDLGYTRHPLALDALIRYLDSEAKLPTLKATQTQGSSEAEAAAGEIAAILVGAPDLSDLSGAAKVATLKAWLENQDHPQFVR